MVVGRRRPSELFLLRHTAGDGAVAFVERIDPVTLEPLAARPSLAGGPVWPGGSGLHDNGSLYVVFGNHAHRLDADLQVRRRTAPCRASGRTTASSTLPDGHLVTKDFGGSLPGVRIAAADREPCELLVLEPDDARRSWPRSMLPEPSIARLSADGDDIYVVGDTSLLRVRWDGTRSRSTTDFTARYRTLDGQTYGWDCVIAAGCGLVPRQRRRQRALRRHAARPRRVDRAAAPRAGRPRRPARSRWPRSAGSPAGSSPTRRSSTNARGVAVGYDSGNGVMAGVRRRPRSSVALAARAGPRQPPRSSTRADRRARDERRCGTRDRRRRPRHRRRARELARADTGPRQSGPSVPDARLRPRLLRLLVHRPSAASQSSSGDTRRLLMDIVLLGTGSPLPDARPRRARPRSCAPAPSTLLVDCGRGVAAAPRRRRVRGDAADRGAADAPAQRPHHRPQRRDHVAVGHVLAPTPLRVIGPPAHPRGGRRHPAMLAATRRGVPARRTTTTSRGQPIVDVEEVTDGVAFDEAGVRGADGADRPPTGPPDQSAYRVEHGGRCVVLAGDTVPCEGLDGLCAGADALRAHRHPRRPRRSTIPAQRIRDILDYHSSVGRGRPHRRQGPASAR